MCVFVQGGESEGVRDSVRVGVCVFLGVCVRRGSPQWEVQRWLAPEASAELRTEKHTRMLSHFKQNNLIMKFNTMM